MLQDLGLSRTGLWRRITRDQAEAAYGGVCEVCGAGDSLVFETVNKPNGKPYTLAELRQAGYQKHLATLMCTSCRKYMKAHNMTAMELRAKMSEDPEFAKDMIQAGHSRAVMSRIMKEGYDKKRLIDIGILTHQYNDIPKVEENPNLYEEELGGF